MANIYKQSKRVVSWLARKSKDSDLAITTIVLLLKNFTTKCTRDDFLQSRIWKSFAAENAPGLASISIVFRRLYWTRMWIVQEFPLAPDQLLICGKNAVPWSILKFFYMVAVHVNATFATQLTGARSSYIEAPFTMGRNAARFFHLRTLEVSARRSTLHDYISKFSDLDCSDPRDKVYALLGLTTHDVGIEVDYYKPANDVFWGTVYSIGLCNVYWNELKAYSRLAASMGVSEQEWKRKALPLWNVEGPAGWTRLTQTQWETICFQTDFGSSVVDHKLRFTPFEF